MIPQIQIPKKLTEREREICSSWRNFAGISQTLSLDTSARAALKTPR